MDGTATAEKPRRSGARFFWLLSAALVAFLVSLVVMLYGPFDSDDAWESELARHLETDAYPGDALAPVLEAFRKTDWTALSERGPQLEQIARQGWTADIEIDRLLNRHQPVFALVSRSAALPNHTLPIPAEALAERRTPNFTRIAAFTHLLVVNARRLEGEKRSEEAAQRLMEVATFGSRFLRPGREASLVTHAIGINTMDYAASALTDLLMQSPPDNPAALARLEAQLAAIEGRVVPLGEAYAAELDVFERTLMARSESPDSLSVALLYYDPELTRGEALETARAHFSILPALPTFMAQLRTALLAELEKPAHQRARLDQAWMESVCRHSLAQLSVAKADQLAVRENLLTARLRLARAICLLKIGPAGQQLPIDPFSGEPLRTRGNVCYSVGPDGVDDQASELYRPGRGLRSGGDVVVVVR